MPTIKLTNNTLIHSESLRIGIDVTNVIASGNINSLPYTATQDCYFKAAVQPARDSLSGFSIDDEGVYWCGTFAADVQNCITYFLKKGSTVKSYTPYHYSNSLGYTVFGTK